MNVATCVYSHPGTPSYIIYLRISPRGFVGLGPSVGWHSDHRQDPSKGLGSREVPGQTKVYTSQR